MNCNDCKNNKTTDLPFLVHEAAMARQERTIKRLWVLCLVLIVLFVGTNFGWLVYESQFEDVSVEQEVETGNGSATVIGMGDINYGESPAEGDLSTATDGR